MVREGPGVLQNCNIRLGMSPDAVEIRGQHIKMIYKDIFILLTLLIHVRFKTSNQDR